MTRQSVVPDFGPELLADLPPSARLLARDSGELLYVQAGGVRYISAARWHMAPEELQEFKALNGGDDYSFSSPASFAFSLWKKHYAPGPPGGFALRFPRDWRFAFCRKALYG